MTAPAEDRAAATFSRVKDLAGLVAPITLVTALLVYFGYVGTRARFEYFGVYLDLADLSNQALVLHGLEVVYVPAALLFLAMLLAVGVHAVVSWLLTVRAATGLAVAAVVGLAGALLTARALIGLLVPEVSAREVPGTSPLALAIGPTLSGYAAWIAAQVGRGRAGRFAAWYAGATVSRLRRAGAVAVTGLAVAGLFWAANSFAWAFGAGRGYDDALSLAQRPEVILDTIEQIADLPPGVTQTVLDGDEGEHRFRYRGLRLLLASGGRLFLVPERWTTDGRTLVLPYDSQVRIQVLPAG